MTSKAKLVRFVQPDRGHPSKIVVDVNPGEQVFMPFVEGIPRKMKLPIVYVLDMLETPFVKIGSTSNPRSRIVSCQTNSPFEVVCAFYACPSVGTSHVDVELRAQASLVQARVRGEWFKASADEAIKAIQAFL